VLTPTEKVKQTVKIDASTVEIEERGVKLRLTVVDTPGFGDSLNSLDWYAYCWLILTGLCRYLVTGFCRFLVTGLCRFLVTGFCGLVVTGFCKFLVTCFLKNSSD